MRFNLAATILSTATLAAAADKALFPSPFKFPLGNNFPAPKSADLLKIEGHAGGALPNGAFPTKLSKAAIEAFQLVAVNELFEVGFFTELLKNLTNGVPGYKVKNQKYVERVIRKIRAQEELHAIGANAILAGVKAETIGPCQYNYGVTDFDSAMLLANTFTDIVLSVVPGVQQLLAEDGGQEPGLIPLVGSILSQEAEQNGWFRYSQGKDPSAAPFLTGGAAQFAASALRLFIVPGSCKFIPPVPFYPPMTAMTMTTGKNQTITYEIEGAASASEMSIVLINGQNLPVTTPIASVMKSGKMSTFKAFLPFETGFARGLTYALLVKGKKTYTSVADAAADGLYGPALLEI